MRIIIAATNAHHHTREQANVGVSGVMEMTLGTHTEPARRRRCHVAVVEFSPERC